MEQIFGAHVEFNGSSKETFKNYRPKVAQIMLGPCMCRGKFVEMVKIKDPENITLDHLIIHSSMMINLSNEKKWGTSVLQSTLKEAGKLQEATQLKIGVVVHIGRGAEDTIELIVARVRSLIIPPNVTLYLENSAGAGSELGYNIDQLIDIFSQLPAKIKLCIDTQHAFSAELTGWQDKEDIDDFFEMLNMHLPNRLGLFHLNDSKVHFGARVDRHENLQEGYIWGKKEHQPHLKYLLEQLLEKKIPTILETPNVSRDLQLIHSILQAPPAAAASKSGA